MQNMINNTLVVDDKNVEEDEKNYILIIII